MAFRLPKDADFETVEWPASLKAVAPGEAMETSRSPARDLQEMLAARTAAGIKLDLPEHIDRWSRRRRLAVLIASTTTLWALILWGIGVGTNLIA